ncbi:hypothetical protein [Herbaspirillum huttiense]|uniref:hypothetical protein n=1 Tax=Herbaspirillum huttiense TaxID=863372 RepID=UPI0031E2B23B
MMISGNQASAAIAAPQPSSGYQTTPEPKKEQETESSKVTISSAALEKATQSETQTDELASQYRLSGPATLVSALNPVVYKMPEALIREMEVRGKEEAVRNAMSVQYANEHQYQTIGQVLVDGKLFAEVNDAGGYGSIQNAIPGLSDSPLSPRERVEEIAQALKGKGKVEVRYADFVPGLGGWGGPGAPDTMLSPFTARSLHDIFAEAIQGAERMRSSTLQAAKSSTL